MTFTDEQVEEILDAFAEESSVEYVAAKTGFPKGPIRELLDDPDTARRAMERKRAIFDVWFAGASLDHLKRILLTTDKPQYTLQAMKLLQDRLSSGGVSVPQPTESSEPSTLEAVLERMNNGSAND